MSGVLAFLGVCACAAVCFFCAGAETGFLNVSRMRVMSLSRRGSAKAKRLERVLMRIPQAVTVLLVGNNIAAVAYSTLCSWMSEHSPVPVQTAVACAGALAMLFGCEYMPKLLFTSRPLRRTLAITPFYEALEKALSPVSAVFSGIARIAFPRREARRRGALSRDSLRSIVADRRNGVALSGFERKLIDRVLTLQTVTAADLMTPAGRMDSVRAGTPLSECVAIARRTGHVHLPVFGEDGALSRVIDVREILRVAKGRPPEGTAANAPRAAVSQPLSISPSTRADDILPLMRRRHLPFAAVRPPSGEVLGVITEEAVLACLMSGLSARDAAPPAA